MNTAMAPVSGLQLDAVSLFSQKLRHARSTLLLLDYDGTLAPFHDDPAQARPYPGVPELLQRLAQESAKGKARTAILTGRSLRSILPLLSMEPLPEIWASHGRENRQVNGAIMAKDPSENQIRGISTGVEACRSASGAFRLEEKPFSIALHVRGISDVSASKILKEAQAVWRPIAHTHDLEILHFDGGIELRAVGWTKGDAVNALLKGSPQDTAVAYLGDDETDEDAFKALGKNGLPVLVRPAWRDTAARAWLRPPKELLEFLERWLEANA